MTQPDELSPSGDLQGAFADFQAKTQEDYEAERTSGETNRWGDNGSGGGILGALFTGLPTGMPFPLALLTMLARAFLGVPTLIWDSVDDLLGDVPILGEAADVIQNFFDALVGGLTGSSTTGNDPIAVVNALIQSGLALPTQAIDALLAALAALTGQVTAIQNNPGGASQTDDFGNGVTGLSAWTNVAGTLVVNSRNVIQTAAEASGYIGTVGTPRKPSTDRHGMTIVVDEKRRGAIRGWISGDATMSNYGALDIYSGFDGDSMRIVTGAGQLVVVQKWSDFVGATRLPNLTTFDIRYDPTGNKFIALRNGQPTLEWIDATNIVTHGSSKRLVGVVSNAASGITDGGFGIRKVTFYDW